MNYEQLTMNNEQPTMNSFMQNKPNLPAPQMNVSSIKTKDYENKRLCSRGQNKPKQSQFAGGSNEHKFCFNKVL